ncbi:MAG: Sec-independent protein translocase subunit TatA [Gammaproteobacteria bacterium]|nr:MAG: Sec-independent protein translocase subunit TatA [Gammaproteobacteria bacterium]
MGGIGIWQLVIVLVIVIVIFGTKKLRNMGGDVGGAIKNFKKAVKDENKDTADTGNVIEGEVTKKEEDKTSS